ncbi:MAG: hypothetical protein QG656_1341, partial [Candidatus Hydrogenedentes bacterium]|nr:hypothetical protein [Candidatus Hydrogenedentota bacterium]
WVLEQPVFGGFTELDAASAHNGAPAARIGFNNDGFLAGETCGGTWTEAPLFSNPGNPEFDYMTRESPYVAVDGELFWADQGGKIDGLRAAVRMRLHHYSSFSLDHSYSGREGKRFSIDDWMATPLTAAQVSEAQLPLSDGYFQDAVGGEMARTPFEYIRDHLGYRIELRWAAFPGGKCPGIPFGVRVTLINRGFAAFPNPRPVYFILIRDGQCVAEWPVPEADPRTWQPFAPGDETYAPLEHTIAAECEIPQGTEPGEYLLALWMPDGREPLRNDPRYAVRTANRDTPWWTDAHGTYGANILGTIWVKPMIMDSHVEFIKHP